MDNQLNQLMQRHFDGLVCMAECAAGVDPNGQRFVNAVAIFAGKLRDALMTQGFTREEAVALVSTQLSLFKLSPVN